MIIPEIKMSEAIEEFDYYLAKIKPHRTIAVNTSGLFNGSLGMLEVIREKYPNKHILRKDFIMLPRHIDESQKAGANYNLLLADFLLREQLNHLIKYSFKKFMLPIIEVNSYQHFLDEINIIIVNSRNLNTGKINRKRAIEVCKQYKEENKVIIYASGEESDILVKEGICDYVLIGTAFMREK